MGFYALGTATLDISHIIGRNEKKIKEAWASTPGGVTPLGCESYHLPFP